MLGVMRWAVAFCIVAFARTASAGGTFEIGFGGGTVTAVRDNGDYKTMMAGSSPTIGAGFRLGERTWVLGRISLVFPKDGSTFAFLGGSMQYFPSDRFFVAGGVGMVEQDFGKDVSVYSDDIAGLLGFGFDLRGGVNLFPEYRHTVLLQVELTPTIYSGSGSMSAMLLASYQYL